nr:unnamed protein product [Amyelois transitella]
MGNFKIVDFNELDEVAQTLVKEAVSVRKRAYCPYSNFAVGAALVTEVDSKVYTGCNVENAALAPSICAERCAVPKAVSEGYTKMSRIAVVAQQEEFTAPCGFCRQTLREFCASDGDMVIYLSKPAMDKVLCTKLSELLPISFVTFKE